MTTQWFDPAPPSLRRFGEGGWSRQEVEVISVIGNDAESFLQGQLSQDIAKLGVGDSAWSLLLDPDGKLGWLLRIQRKSDDSFALLGNTGEAEGITNRLRRFKLRVNVTLGTDRRWLLSSTLPGDVASLGQPLVQLFSDLGMRQWLSSIEPAFDDEDECEPNDWEQWCTWNWVVSSEQAEAGMIPYELGAGIVEQAVSFTKGCYTGQELVARLDSRGTPPPRILSALRSKGQLFEGETLVNGTDEIGTIHRVVYDSDSSITHGFVLVKRKFAPESATRILSNGIEVELIPLEALIGGA